eukprot:2788121-Heterocapsa_arctica.AAC.1
MGSRTATPNTVRLERPLFQAEALAEQLKIAAEARRGSAEHELMHRAPTDERESELTNELIVHGNTFRGPFALTGLRKPKVNDAAPPLRVNEDVAAP